MQALPKRLQIDFRSKKPTYELYTPKGCTKRDLLAAGVPVEAADSLLWNSYAKKPMQYTLVSPEEWFWTDRKWWSESDQRYVALMYDIAGGCFSDLSPREQAQLFGVEYLALTGKRAKRNRWRNSQGEELDLVRYERSRLVEDGYDMSPAYSESINLLVKTYCKQRFGKDITFLGASMADADELRHFAKLSAEYVVNNPGEVWDQKPEYYFSILNGFRKIKDFDRTALLETVRVVGSDTCGAILSHFWAHQTYENQMTGPSIPLAGRKDGRLMFFFVTQNASFGSGVAGFMRDYALPLGSKVSMVQLSPDVNARALN